MTKIEWCDETINPLGHWCFGPGGTKENLKPCVYCYAKKMARRGMNGCEKCQSFNVPHTHFEQLDKLTAWKKSRNIFVQSMGDLFHDDVPDKWIEQVFKACREAPQHRYLFLTKNPKRYIDLYQKYDLTKFWLGSTVTDENTPYYYNGITNTFLSIEPIQNNFTTSNSIEIVDWVIIGAETGNRKGKVIPKKEWVQNILDKCREQNIPVFMKNSLAPIWGEPLIQEYPW
jgi:protein gp37